MRAAVFAAQLPSSQLLLVWVPCPMCADDPATVVPQDTLLVLFTVVCSWQNVPKNITQKNLDNKT